MANFFIAATEAHYSLGSVDSPTTWHTNSLFQDFSLYAYQVLIHFIVWSVFLKLNYPYQIWTPNIFVFFFPLSFSYSLLQRMNTFSSVMSIF